MYIHYYLDTQLTVVKVSGDMKGIKYPPTLSLGHNINDQAPEIAREVKCLIKENEIQSAIFSNETPVYNLGFFEQVYDDPEVRGYFRIWQLSEPHDDEGITYLLEYSNQPDMISLDKIDRDVIENIEIARFRDIAKVSSIGILQVDELWRTLYASKTWSDMTGYSLTDIADREWTQILHPDDKGAFLELLHEHAEAEKNSEQDVRIHTVNGSMKWFNVHYRISYDRINDCKSIILIFLDIHNKRLGQEHLKLLATTDGLTQLGNRYAFQAELERYIRQLHSNLPFDLIFLDLDGFKSVNDAYGHMVGDKLLNETARRISNLVGKVGFVARLGGDEFAIIRPQHCNPPIELLANKLLREIAQPYNLVNQTQESYVSASMGIVQIGKSTIPYEETLSDSNVQKIGNELQRQADTAMYDAKDAGKNTFCIYVEAINEKVLKRQILTDALHKAIECEEFYLHYQPQWDIKHDRLYGYEALIRWGKSSNRMSPERFIPIAESSGLMTRLGKWVFDSAVKEHANLVKSHVEPPLLSVNFSPIQFRDHNLCNFIQHTLRKYNVSAKSITLEVTESLLILDHLQVRVQLEEIKELGLKIALDDFGTGYSSLSNLHNFPIDIIKVDRSFTQNLAHNNETRQIVRAIIKMGLVLNKMVLFEGIETKQQLDYLKGEGVDIIQGWLISKAVPPDCLTQFISHKEAELECLTS